jgi:hypothetical protein
MTNVAYLLFTFFACLLGFGVGLLINGLWRKLHANSDKQVEILVAADKNDDSGAFDAYSKWQSDNNRAFATQVMACCSAPIVFAGLAWGQRSDVVHTVCGTITQVAGQAYICM